MQKCKELQKLHASYAALLSSFNNHNIESAQKSINTMRALEEEFWINVDSYLQAVDSELEGLKALYQSNEDYLQKLKSALEEKGISPDVKDSSLIIGPMEVLVNVEEHYLQLIMGRKKKRIMDLELGKVSKVVEQSYKKAKLFLQSQCLPETLTKSL
ncbi:MAG: hypothetical protein LRZ88_06015 [Candidatus Cloacimonetes bacterium]|nr:hypothetical protein [Candidatus Cloacimonadota bacterium]